MADDTEAVKTKTEKWKTSISKVVKLRNNLTPALFIITKAKKALLLNG